MKPVQRILVALDLTETSDDVWKEARAVARVFGAEVHLVHVVTDVAADAPGFARAARGVEGRLDELVRGCDAGVRCSTHHFIRAGEPAAAILSCAKDIDADLLVIGAGIKAGLGAAIFGNAAESIVHEAETPVWVVHPGRSHARFERIVVAVDPADPRREAIHAAALVARASGGRLRLLAIARSGEARADDEAATRLALRQAVAGTAAEALDVEVEVRHARKPAWELVSEAGRAQTDLLVMGVSSRQGLRRLLERDAVEKVLRVAPCSILRVPRVRRSASTEVA